MGKEKLKFAVVLILFCMAFIFPAENHARAQEAVRIYAPPPPPGAFGESDLRVNMSIAGKIGDNVALDYILEIERRAGIDFAKP